MTTNKPKLLQVHEFYILVFNDMKVYVRVTVDNLVDTKTVVRDSIPVPVGLDRVDLEKYLSQEFGVGIQQVMNRDDALARRKQSWQTQQQ